MIYDHLYTSGRLQTVRGVSSRSHSISTNPPSRLGALLGIVLYRLQYNVYDLPMRRDDSNTVWYVLCADAAAIICGMCDMYALAYMRDGAVPSHIIGRPIVMSD